MFEDDRHFMLEKVIAKVINIPFVKSENQLTAVLDKAVASAQHHDIIGKLSMVDVCASG